MSGSDYALAIFMSMTSTTRAHLRKCSVGLPFLFAQAAPLSALFTHLDIYLTFIPDIDPCRVSNDVTMLVIVEGNQTEGWHHINSYWQIVFELSTNFDFTIVYQDPMT